MLFKESILSTRYLRTDLYETLTHDVYRSVIENYEEIFGIGPRLQNYLFSTTWQLNDNFEGQYLWRRTRQRQSGNGVGNYEGSPTSSQTFMNFSSLAAKITILRNHHLFGVLFHMQSQLVRKPVTHVGLAAKTSTVSPVDETGDIQSAFAV